MKQISITIPQLALLLVAMFITLTIFYMDRVIVSPASPSRQTLDSLLPSKVTE